MRSVHIPVGQGYDVLMGEGVSAHAGEVLKERFGMRTAVLLTDTAVNALYAGPVMQSLSSAGFRVLRYAFAGGEANKSLRTAGEILCFLSENGVTRSDLLIALGGGIVGDVAGFCAAIYQRGMRFVQIPTTFLAAVDASVGGKTGVNLKTGKNLIGAFWQPACVICDVNTFSTLPREAFLDGVAEAIKYGVLKDERLFDKLKSEKALSDMVGIVERCVRIKSRFVAEDERDKGLRQMLNLGHTLGHAIETVSQYEISHGHAVAIGMAAAARAAEKLHYAEEPVSGPILAALKTHGLPAATALPIDALLNAMTRDKKRAGDTINLILPKRIGQCIIQPWPVKRLREYIEEGMEGV